MPRRAAPRDRWTPRPAVAALRAAAALQRLCTGHLLAPSREEPAAAAAAAARYVRFLGLAAGAGGRLPFLVPTPDMDLVWHAHLMATAAYGRDTTALLGHVYVHTVDDDGTPGGRLDDGRAATAAALREKCGGLSRQWLDILALDRLDFDRLTLLLSVPDAGISRTSCQDNQHDLPG